MRLAVVTTTWGRPLLTDLFFRYYAGLNMHGIELDLYCAISPEDDHGAFIAKSAQENKWTINIRPNRPLCEKWNTTLALTHTRDPDAVLTIDSDDFLNERMFRSALYHLRLGQHWVQPDWVHFYHIMKHRLIRRNLKQNGIRFWSRHAVDELGWRLWRNQPSAMAMNKAQDLHVGDKFTLKHMRRNDDAVALDVKGAGMTRVPFWKYERVLQGDDLDPDEFFQKHFTDVYQEIRGWVQNGL